MPVVRIRLVAEAAATRDQSIISPTTSNGNSHVWLENAFVVTTNKVSRQVANVIVALLTPAALSAFVFGLWRIGADLGWAGAFPIPDGLFSHWQVWIAAAIGLKIVSSTLIAWGAKTRKFSEEN